MEETTEAEHFLGLDYGKAKIGLAVADSETKIAFAHSTLDNDQNIFDKIGDIIVAEAVSGVVIGKPKETDQYDSVSVSSFASEIAEMFPLIKIEFEDEMFTTKMAEDRLKEKGAKKIKNLDNQEAARIILQSWLDRQ
ncbi:MAG: Holliday junction resolvase YqgF [Candidatus Moranbacteria bacterium GW2011_GWA2_39_41]|nr:MAG: Holliday junction resolvase YqgF [Candidatus Moranbacteria bacterium GW2011_GWA2_39_41]